MWAPWAGTVGASGRVGPGGRVRGQEWRAEWVGRAGCGEQGGGGAGDGLIVRGTWRMKSAQADL